MGQKITFNQKQLDLYLELWPGPLKSVNQKSRRERLSATNTMNTPGVCGKKIWFFCLKVRAGATWSATRSRRSSSGSGLSLRRSSSSRLAATTVRRRARSSWKRKRWVWYVLYVLKLKPRLSPWNWPSAAAARFTFTRIPLLTLPLNNVRFAAPSASRRRVANTEAAASKLTPNLIPYPVCKKKIKIGRRAYFYWTCVF